MRKAMIGILLAALIGVVGWKCGMMFLLTGRFTTPTKAEYESLAKTGVPIVQAICEYRHDNGVMPRSFEDLVPRYLPSRPDNTWMLTDDSLDRSAGVPHTGVFYVFREDEEGWFVGGDFANYPLSLPKQASTRPVVSEDALLAAKLAEFDRRIATGKSLAEKCHTSREKIEALIAGGMLDQARQACAAASALDAEWWRPPAIRAWLDNTPAAVDMFESWVKLHPSFVAWHAVFAMRERLNDADGCLRAIAGALETPFYDYDNSDSDWVNASLMYDMCRHALLAGQHDLLLELCDKWALHASGERSDYAFRAAALLAKMKFDEAKIAIDAGIKEDAESRNWADHLQELKHAIESRDRNYHYDPGSHSVGAWKPYR